MKKPLALVLSLALSTIPLAAPAYADTLPATDTTASTTTTTNTSGEVVTAVPVPDSTTTTSASTSTTTTTTTTTPATGTTDSTLPPVQDANGQTVTPGTLPDSPFYWLSTLIQKLQLALTFDPAQKSALEERLALQNLAAARELASHGKQAPAEVALQGYADKITKAQEFLTKVKDPTSADAQKLQEALAQVSAKNIQVLDGLLDKLPPQAAQKVALNVVRSMEKAVKKMDTTDQKKVNQTLNKVTQKAGDANLDQETKDALANFQKELGAGVKEQKDEQEQDQVQENKHANGKQLKQNEDKEVNDEKTDKDKNKDKDKEKEQDTDTDTDTDKDSQKLKAQTTAPTTQPSSGSTVQTPPVQGGNPAQKENGKAYGKDKHDKGTNAKSGQEND